MTSLEEGDICTVLFANASVFYSVIPVTCLIISIALLLTQNSENTPPARISQTLAGPGKFDYTRFNKHVVVAYDVCVMLKFVLIYCLVTSTHTFFEVKIFVYILF
jgi:hypothetical protein